MSELTNIPANLKTDFLRESESAVLPEIRTENGKIIIPVFIRQETRTEGEQQFTVYRYFDVSVPNVGQNISDYNLCVRQSYAALRRHFYGDWAVQNEQILKGEFAAHQYAVRQAFPKYEGESIAAVERFEAIKGEFWGLIDEVLAALGKTRKDLPAQPFNAETMLAWATQQGMSAADQANYATKFIAVSVNLLHNERNWNELF